MTALILVLRSVLIPVRMPMPVKMLMRMPRLIEALLLLLKPRVSQDWGNDGRQNRVARRHLVGGHVAGGEG